jgi:ABC-type transport system involved in cytochrome c biogenesis permease subunit
MGKPPLIPTIVYRAYLHARLQRCSRALQVLAAQRANDALAEHWLTREAESVRSKLQSL